jgi:L-cysteine desulfidase
MSSYVHQEHTRRRARGVAGKGSTVNIANQGFTQLFSNQNFFVTEKNLLRRALFSHPFNIHINIDQGSVYTQYKLETKTYTE